jgi:hypothetical protein
VPQEIAMLIAIKLLHTIIWALLAVCVFAIPIVGLRGRFKWALILTALVLFECGILALNHGRCPLTDAAARYTSARADNFDIYLPGWLARRNKEIFGTLFVIGEMAVLGRWLAQARS